MRWTQTLIPTQKNVPADAQIISHQLMLRAGLIRQLTAGAYDFLPLGWRAMQKASQIAREEMDAIGCAEVFLPALQPAELWQKTGRDVSYGENLMKFKDRHGRLNVLGPTHEEVVTELVGAFVTSYKQLPVSLYQIQTKFRDEYRPRFGLLRVREFLMKDAYSFHANLESLNRTYEDFYHAYERIFTRCGIPYVVVEAESGPIGGSASHEFMAACAAGEDMIVTSDKGNYAANVEKAEIGDRAWTFDGAPKGELQKVHTPHMPTIEEVGKFMKVKPKNMLKTLVFRAAEAAAPGQGAVPPQTDIEHDPAIAAPAQAQGGAVKWVVAVVRGDHDVNEAKLAKAARTSFGFDGVQLVDTPEVRDEWPIGFVAPDAAARHPAAVVLVDPDAAQDTFWASGANEIDYHVKYFNWRRELGAAVDDAKKVAVADIRNANDGDPSPRNDGGVLKAARGIEIGHVFKLGTKYSVALDAMYLDDKGQRNPFIMGCYGIGVGRILIAAVESLHDDNGIIWPTAIAPYSVIITPVKYDGAVKAAADKLHDELNAAGIDTLLDDRDARAGFKFADADLIGIPVRITVGDRGLQEGAVELKKRTAAQPTMVKLDNVIVAVRDALKG